MPPRVLSRRDVFVGETLRVEQQRLELANGRPFTTDVVFHPPSTAVVAIDAHNQVVLVRQHRYAANVATLEVPAGVTEEGEPALACAKRELEEEVGVVAEFWQPLGAIWTSPGVLSERVDLFLAEGLQNTQQKLDDDEEIEVVRVPFQEAVRRAQRGLIEDATTVSALLRAEGVRRDKFGA